MDPCPFCRVPLALLFATRDYRRAGDQGLYEVGWCEACKYGRVLGDHSAEQVKSFYEMPYYTHTPQWVAGSRRQSLMDKLRMHLAWRADSGADLHPAEGTGRSLLDIGCGSGGNLARFAESGFVTMGIEPDAEARKVAGKIGEIYEGTAEALPKEISGRKFDTVLFSHVLEHCIDPSAALANARKLVAPGGRLIIEVPNNEAVAFQKFKQLWPFTDVPRHLHFFTESSLRELVKLAGFRPTAVLHVGYFRQFHPEWIRQQEEIWKTAGDGRAKPNFDRDAWRLLADTWRAAAARKYDSIRIHASPMEHVTPTAPATAPPLH
jgi:SAM-dependent methyltransferase